MGRAEARRNCEWYLRRWQWYVMWVLGHIIPVGSCNRDVFAPTTCCGLWCKQRWLISEWIRIRSVGWSPDLCWMWTPHIQCHIFQIHGGLTPNHTWSQSGPFIYLLFLWQPCNQSHQIIVLNCWVMTQLLCHAAQVHVLFIWTYSFGSVMVRASDFWLKGGRFDSRPVGEMWDGEAIEHRSPMTTSMAKASNPSLLLECCSSRLSTSPGKCVL